MRVFGEGVFSLVRAISRVLVSALRPKLASAAPLASPSRAGPGQARLQPGPLLPHPFRRFSSRDPQVNQKTPEVQRPPQARSGLVGVGRYTSQLTHHRASGYVHTQHYAYQSTNCKPLHEGLPLPKCSYILQGQARVFFMQDKLRRHAVSRTYHSPRLLGHPRRHHWRR